MTTDIMTYTMITQTMKDQDFKFIDADFPPTSQSVFGKAGDTSFDQPIVWKRPAKSIPLYGDKGVPSPDDIV